MNLQSLTLQLRSGQVSNLFKSAKLFLDSYLVIREVRGEPGLFINPIGNDNSDRKESYYE